jgi:ribonuclease P protein component
VLKNALPYSRICFTFSRGFGNAVERNRARRLGREVWRHLRPRLAGGYDVILLVYPEPPQTAGGAAQADGLAAQSGGLAAQAGGLATRKEQLTFLLSKAGLLR